VLGYILGKFFIWANFSFGHPVADPLGSKKKDRVQEPRLLLLLPPPLLLWLRLPQPRLRSSLCLASTVSHIHGKILLICSRIKEGGGAEWAWAAHSRTF
jgi:hypothetical protein